jgi:hypothetical protein
MRTGRVLDVQKLLRKSYGPLRKSYGLFRKFIFAGVVAGAVKE